MKKRDFESKKTGFFERAKRYDFIERADRNRVKL
jgi:hypothetical protein